MEPSESERIEQAARTVRRWFLLAVVVLLAVVPIVWVVADPFGAVGLVVAALIIAGVGVFYLPSRMRGDARRRERAGGV
jgi:hypothetical protein